MDHNSQAPPLHHQQQPHAGGMMLPSGNTYHHHQLATNLSNASPQMISPNSSALLQKNPFPFNPSVATPPASKPLEPLNSAFSGDGSSGLRPGSGGDGGFSIDHVKKKRGRPRKYSPDGGSNIALGLAPTPASTAVVRGDHTENPSSEAPSSKKHRGRSPGSGKRQLDALGNCGVGFTPHVIFVKAGEIYILLYKEVALVLKINSVYSKRRLLNIHENVRVLRFPDHFAIGVYLWSHHEKIAIIDYQVCFIGGLDLCFGRYDTNEHKVSDYPPAIMPGKDYYNLR